MAQAGLAKRASCHTFRHSFATRLLEDCSDIRTVEFRFLLFNPASLPAGYVRLVRITTTAGTLAFGAAAAYGYVMLQRTLDTEAKDVEGALLLLKAAFLFAVTGVTGGVALILAIVAIRCWVAGR